MPLVRACLSPEKRRQGAVRRAGQPGRGNGFPGGGRGHQRPDGPGGKKASLPFSCRATKPFSVGSAGCNFRCRFCQKLPDSAHTGQRHDCPASASRQTPWCGWRVDARTTWPLPTTSPRSFSSRSMKPPGWPGHGHAGHSGQLNGFMAEDFLLPLRRRVNAVNVDLKSFSDDFTASTAAAAAFSPSGQFEGHQGAGLVAGSDHPGHSGCNDEEAEHGIWPPCAWRTGPGHALASLDLSGAYPHGQASLTPPARLEDAWRIGREAGLPISCTSAMWPARWAALPLSNLRRAGH